MGVGHRVIARAGLFSGALVLGLTCIARHAVVAQARPPLFGLGRAPAPGEVNRLDIDVTPDGKGLLDGSGTAVIGKTIYTNRCATCHGPTGVEGPQDILVGGQGTLRGPGRPLKTIGSYWPYATTLWDYINRAMPFDHPSTLTPDEVYSTTAYLLFLNGIVGEQDVISRSSLPNVRMPNRDGFTSDPRPDAGDQKPASPPALPRRSRVGRGSGGSR
jgi:cytochrome c